MKRIALNKCLMVLSRQRKYCKSPKVLIIYAGGALPQGAYLKVNKRRV